MPLKVCGIPRLQGLANDLSYPCGAVASSLCTLGWPGGGGGKCGTQFVRPTVHSGISFWPRQVGGPEPTTLLAGHQFPTLAVPTCGRENPYFNSTVSIMNKDAVYTYMYLLYEADLGVL